jgi:hypothetical protein
MGVNADAFGRAMIHRGEHRCLTLAGENGCQTIVSSVSGMIVPSCVRGAVGLQPGGTHAGGYQRTILAHPSEHAP